jgi:hypothetical protein
MKVFVWQATERMERLKREVPVSARSAARPWNSARPSICWKAEGFRKNGMLSRISSEAKCMRKKFF